MLYLVCLQCSKPRTSSGCSCTDCCFRGCHSNNFCSFSSKQHAPNSIHSSFSMWDTWRIPIQQHHPKTTRSPPRQVKLKVKLHTTRVTRRVNNQKHRFPIRYRGAHRHPIGNSLRGVWLHANSIGLLHVIRAWWK